MQLSQLSTQLITPAAHSSSPVSSNLTSPLVHAPSSHPHREPFVPPPEHYVGDLGSCVCFLLQCSLVFDQQPSSYSSDRSRISYVMPIPSHPWSHIALDFVTGLLSLNNHSVILTIATYCSKCVHFVSLTKLPTALETAEIQVNHVFRQHGIPVLTMVTVHLSSLAGCWRSSQSHLWLPPVVQRPN